MSWNLLAQGALHKMQAAPLSADDQTLQYKLCVDEQQFAINGLLGKQIRLQFLGDIYCQNCNVRTPKSYGQGYCYGCFSTLAQCDMCMMSPERCHYSAGTCRNPEWGELFCMSEHVVYLANTSGVKVGITRASQVPTRWIDQGAAQALPIFRVATRQQSGLIEEILKQQVADKTNWRTLLKADAESIDLTLARDQLLTNSYTMLAKLQATYGMESIQPVLNGQVATFKYPVRCYPDKVVSHNLDKLPVMEGTLEGIKGQYLILDTGVINVRKYTAYQVAVLVK